MIEVEHLLPVQNHLGEGPVWHPGENALYWVDILSNTIYRYLPSERRHERYGVDMQVTALVPRTRGGWVASTCDGFAFWNHRSSRLEHISAPEADREEIRFNDGACDPLGRFWAGTMNHRTPETPDGTLYRLDPDLSVHQVETGFTVSNGIGWSPDHRTMYFTDSERRVILAYDFDPTTGEIRNRRPFVRVPEQDGYPDGLAVDVEGGVWSACWGGRQVIRYDPAGRITDRLGVPALNVSSCAFGGAGLDELYITSAWEHMSAAQRNQHPLSGDLFRARAGVQGMATFPFAG